MDETTRVPHRLELSCKPWGTFPSDDGRMSSDASSVTFARSIMIRRRVPGSSHRASCGVRRAFLCGEVRLTGGSFVHRRQSVGNRKQVRAAVFGMGTCGQAVVSKPLHVVAQVLPQAVSRWSDAHVVGPWMRGFRRQDQIAKARFQAPAGQV